MNPLRQSWRNISRWSLEKHTTRKQTMRVSYKILAEGKVSNVWRSVSRECVPILQEPETIS